MVVAETAAHLHSFKFTKANLLLKNRAICEQKGSGSSQQYVPAGCAFRLTTGTVYLGGCIAIM